MSAETVDSAQSQRLQTPVSLWLWLILTSVAAPAMAAAETPTSTVPIEQAIDGGRLLQAEQMLDRWHPDAGPDSIAVAERLAAEVALARHRDAEAVARLELLEKNGLTGCRLDEGLGIGYLRLGRHKDALGPLLRATSACPDRWQSWNALGIAQDFQKAWSDSHAAYERAYALADQPAAVANNFGFSLLLQHRSREAARLFAQALKTQPDNVRYANNRDIADTLAGQPLLISAADNGRSPDAWARRLNNAGYVSLLSGRTDAATAYFSRSLAESSSHLPQAQGNLETIGAGLDD